MHEHHNRKKNWILPALATALLFSSTFFSCKNDLQTVVKLTRKDSIPSVRIKNINVTQSEMGKITLTLTAPEMVNYQNEDTYTEFPKGVKIIFYDSLMKPKSELTAKYGISWDRRHTMEARGNVVVLNYQKNEKLNTELLRWDKDKKLVSSPEFVKITTPEKIVTGTGMESDEIFDNWRILNISGYFYVNGAL